MLSFSSGKYVNQLAKQKSEAGVMIEESEWKDCPDCRGNGWTCPSIDGFSGRTTCFSCEGGGVIRNIPVPELSFRAELETKISRIGEDTAKRVCEAFGQTHKSRNDVLSIITEGLKTAVKIQSLTARCCIEGYAIERDELAECLKIALGYLSQDNSNCSEADFTRMQKAARSA